MAVGTGRGSTCCRLANVPSSFARRARNQVWCQCVVRGEKTWNIVPSKYFSARFVNVSRPEVRLLDLSHTTLTSLPLLYPLVHVGKVPSSRFQNTEQKSLSIAGPGPNRIPIYRISQNLITCSLWYRQPLARAATLNISLILCII